MNKTSGRSGRNNKIQKGLRHLWHLLLDGRVANDIIEVAPDPSTNILRNVTDPQRNQDAATKGYTDTNIASSIATALAGLSTDGYFLAPDAYELDSTSENFIRTDNWGNNIKVPDASTMPIGKEYVLMSPVDVQAVASKSDYVNINFLNSDLNDYDNGLYKLNAPNSFIKISSDGTNWNIVGNSSTKFVTDVVTPFFTVKPWDRVVLVDATAGNAVINLPEVNDTHQSENKDIYIKRIDGSGNTVTIQSNGQNIDNATSKTLVQNESVHLIPDLTQWRIISNKVDPAGGGGGDMLAATYDPTAVGGDAFSMGNMVETATAKVLTDVERAAIGSALQSGDIDTLAELNAIITDATLIDTTDSRLSDARTPTAHNHTASDITDFDTEVSNNASVAANTAKISATGSELEATDIDTLAELNAIITDATLIDTTDSRLSDSRTPNGSAGGDLTGTYPNPTISNGAVTNIKMPNMAAKTLKGNQSIFPGAVSDLTDSQVRTMLNVEDGATADQTDAEIKTAYEANANTNAFTDAEQTKLGAIEANATADQTDAEIRTAVENATDSNVFTDADHTKLDGITTGATANAKATATELNTGTDDVKFATALALQGSKYLDQSGSKISATAAGTNTYTATIAPAITAYAVNQRFYITFTNANTGAATINLNGLGAKALKKDVTLDLTNGDIKAGTRAVIAYDGTNFQISGIASGVISGAFIMNGIVSPAQFTADIHSTALTGLDLPNKSIMRIDIDNNRSMTGIPSAGMVNGQVQTIVNISTKTLQLLNNDAGSPAADRFLLVAGLNIQSNESVSVWYDTVNSRWRAWAANI